MFGFISASWKELDKGQQDRYSGVYCGICREIKTRASQAARMGLSYDMAFLALLLMSLYEPEEPPPAALRDPSAAAADWVVLKFVGYAAI